MWKKGCAPLLLLAFVVGCQGIDDAGGVSGTVYNISAGGVIEGVTVSIEGSSDSTDELGAFALENIPDGQHFITASKLGYDTCNGTVEVVADTVVTYNIGMHYSAVVTVPEMLPAAPDSLKVAGGDEKSIVFWGGTARADTYNLYWRTSPGVTIENGVKIAGVASPYIHAPLTNTLRYYYIVTAENDFGESTPSGEATTIPSSPPGFAGTCSHPLDNETLQRVFITWPFFPLEIQPGESYAFELYQRADGPYPFAFEQVGACVRWSAAPSEGARIDPLTGLFEVDNATPPGITYTIIADIENGRNMLTRDITVYTPAANPLVGRWSEAAQISCDYERTLPPAEPINEIMFFANGVFTVARYPFEIYVDYKGSYACDLDSGRLMLDVWYGDYVPGDFDGEGTFALTADGRLVLIDIWLGSPRGTSDAPACGHVLAP